MLFQRLSDNELFGPLTDMQRLHESLNRLLTMSTQTEGREFPLVNVWTGEGGAVIRLEMPGINIEDVDISVVKDTVTVKGSRKPQQPSEGQSLVRQERGFGQFSRSLQLPFSVDQEKVQAKFTSGILEITLPRAESEKPRKIAVTVA
ncbi:MAG TPA: Hsp20/alpha crystallin family protein [Planktothrix sp.]|jgi:HSP20 family protein